MRMVWLGALAFVAGWHTASVDAFGPSPKIKPEAVCSVLGGQNGNGDDWYDCSKCDGVTGITFPPNAQLGIVAANAFRNCTKVQTVNLTTNPCLTSIGEGAFFSCSNLSSITIPEGVTSIGEGAFFSCSNLSSITIPEGVTSIGEGAFECCSNMSSIIIPEGATSIGKKAFEGCRKLSSITIPEGLFLTFHFLHGIVPVHE